MKRLESKVAVVTGASRGVGRGIALALGEQGAIVYVTARSVRGASTRPYLPGTTVDDTAEQASERGGVGIPVQIQDRVLDPFFSTKPKNEGTGLGLSISYGIVKDHGGRLRFDSVEGQYTKVMVDLPVDDRQALGAD